MIWTATWLLGDCYAIGLEYTLHLQEVRESSGREAAVGDQVRDGVLAISGRRCHIREGFPYELHLKKVRQPAR